MRIKQLVTVVSAIGLVATPMIAQAAGASSLREGSAVEDSEGLVSGVVIGVLAAAAIIAGIVVIADDDDDNNFPDSP